MNRQNSLFVAEDWLRVYEAMENVNFRAYDWETLVSSVVEYLKENYPEEYNDFIASSEFMMKLEILAWLSQNIMFRVDLNARENFLLTAERRESLLKIARMLGYKVNRTMPARGFLKIMSVRTNEPIIDLDGRSLAGKTIQWDDPRDDFWYEKFMTVLDTAFNQRTKFGDPADFFEGDKRLERYEFNSTMPDGGYIQFGAKVDGSSYQFGLHAFRIDTENGRIVETSPAVTNPVSVAYITDRGGVSSPETGFYIPFKQGVIRSHEVFIDNANAFYRVTLPDTSITNDDIYVVEVDDAGNIIREWAQVDSVVGEGVTFNGEVTNYVFEVETLDRDGVRIVFGDGIYGEIPNGRFRFYYRVSSAIPPVMKPKSFTPKTITIPYVSNGNTYNLTMTLTLTETVYNGTISETNLDIRERARRVFYTQNRLVTAEDYNMFFLRDNTIRKVKSVNREYVGQSRYGRVTDPTSLYDNVTHIASDGRIYEDFVRRETVVTAETVRLPTKTLINKFIVPKLGSADKIHLYRNHFTPIGVSRDAYWRTDSIVDGWARGNIVDASGNAIPVGSGNDAFGMIRQGSIINLGAASDVHMIVDRVLGDGTSPGSIYLRGNPNSGLRLQSVLPPIRTELTTDEMSELVQRVNNLETFAITWSNSEFKWNFIDASNVDETGDFSLTYQGDTTGSGRDSSWFVLMKIDVTNNNWRIIDRGYSLVFESASEVDFVVFNDRLTVDMITNKSTRDRITILPCNETRDSPSRLGIDVECCSDSNVVYSQWVYDGVQSDFKTNVTPIDPTRAMVFHNGNLLSYGTDFVITNDPTGDVISILAPLNPGDLIEFRYDDGRIIVPISASIMTPIDSRTFEVSSLPVAGDNTMGFVDGISQIPSVDYSLAFDNNRTVAIMSQPFTGGVDFAMYQFSGTDDVVYPAIRRFGDGSTTDFDIPVVGVSPDQIMVFVDGVFQNQNNWSLISGNSYTTVSLNSPPASNSVIMIRYPADPDNFSVDYRQEIGDGSTAVFSVSGMRFNSGATNALVFIDGVLQYGPWAGASSSWVYDSSNGTIEFSEPPAAGTVVDILSMNDILASASRYYAGVDSNVITEGDTTGLVSGDCGARFIGRDIDLVPYEMTKHVDGYSNADAVMVYPIDANLDGFEDYPFLFRDLVRTDGSDIIMWRKTVYKGHDYWQPVDETTNPKATYGHSISGGIGAGDAVSSDRGAYDIHLDLSTGVWLTVDQESNTWVAAVDQQKYRYRIGRSGIKFMWRHYSDESHRIDPARTNVVDVYIITDGYYRAVRDWVRNGADPSTMPQPETPEYLQMLYGDIDGHKMISDHVVFRNGGFKFLFGNMADPEVQATFRVVKSNGSRLSDQELKLKIIATIEDYFDIDKWDFGESFYFTELAAYIHTALAGDVQSIVATPKIPGVSFGSMWYIRSEPTEVFMPVLNTSDIEIVPSLNSVTLDVQ